MQKIKWNPYVLGCNVGGTIYLHPNLIDYPELYEKVLAHEVEHTDSYDHRDFFLDLNNSHLRGVKKQYYKFLLKHPKSMVGLLPVMRLDKKWVFDLNLAALYFLSLVGAIAIGLTIGGVI